MRGCATNACAFVNAIHKVCQRVSGKLNATVRLKQWPCKLLWFERHHTSSKFHMYIFSKPNLMIIDSYIYKDLIRNLPKPGSLCELVGL